MSGFSPEKYSGIAREELAERVLAIKKEYGSRLLILTHHYQRDEIVRLGDVRGDSLALARKAANSRAEFIVFCGVHFMAESADILTEPYQTVQLPDLNAGCPMADMADADYLETAWNELTTATSSVTPVVYINSSARTKAFCGDHDGSVCTSANAETIIDWGLKKTEKVLFLPDEHLGRNVGNRLGLSGDDIILWDPDLPMGGNSVSVINKARLILWKGFCHVHTHFDTSHVLEARAKEPGARIIVHLETNERVVALADDAGSTSLIEKSVKNAEAGSVFFIGTELNMVSRLAKENPDKKVYALSRSLCPNMYKIDLPKLLYTLENPGKVNLVTVSEDIKRRTLKPLERMLFIMNTDAPHMPQEPVALHNVGVQI